MSKFVSELDGKKVKSEARIPGNTFKYIKRFSRIILAEGEQLEMATPGDEELGILVLEGSCDLQVGGKEYKSIGKRKNVFDGVPAGIYIPVETNFKLIGHGATLAFCSGKCSKKAEVAVVRPENVTVKQVGKDNWQREVRIIIGPDGPSVNLILGETINPPGNWSGTPAHKHEVHDLPNESLHEELYYFETDKPQGFGVEKFYSPERNIDELIPLKNGTVTYMPWGYHQIVAGPGYTLYYLFFLCGEGKQLTARTEPEHDWINK